MTLTDRGRTPPLVVNAKERWRKDGARAMTPKQKVQVHIQIERENRRKLNEWKQKKGGGNRAELPCKVVA